MPKKSTQWVTIPEATLHTPASGDGKTVAPKKGNPELVKNKLLWGIGFMVVLVAAFAVMAPGQFSQLLKGSLFDTAGVSEDQTPGIINPLSLLPSETPKTDQVAAQEEVAQEEVQAEPVVKPQDKPMEIAVEPIVTPETVDVAPIATGPVDCKTDMACLLPHLADCSLAKGVFAYSVLGQAIEADLEITGAEGDNCLTKAVITKVPQADLVGKDAVCKLPKGVYTQESLQAKFSDPVALAEVCTGSAVEALKGYFGLLSAGDSQAQLVEQLRKQVEQLQAQKDQSNKAMQDLVNTVQEQGVHPAAEAPGTSTALQPGFRVNPYRVTISPEQMLRQNAASGTPQYTATAMGSYQPAPAAAQPTYQYGPVTGGKTPQTGPETTALALFVAFVALVSWKFMRVFAKNV